MNEELLGIAKLRLAPSKVHGIGVFATRDIGTHERVYADEFPKVFQVDTDTLPREILERHGTALKRKTLAYPDVRFQAYMNHSNDPNYSNKTDRALKEIKKGDEITEDYRNIEGWEKLYTFIQFTNDK